MATEPAIVLTDDSDKEVEEISVGPSRQRAQTRRSTSERSIGPSGTRPRSKRRIASSTVSPGTTVPSINRRRNPRPQDAVVDLTSTPDEEVVVLGTPPASSRNAAKRKAPISNLPDSPVSRPSAKCGICFHNMDEKMCCGPCGHVFCETCLRQAVKTQKKCPTCRRNLQPKQLHRVFFNT